MGIIVLGQEKFEIKVAKKIKTPVSC